ncbi:acyl-CoA-like ligand-binding transcription factor [Rhodococcus tukisamuensis]|uniref:DNA-binding transcriptional regulator, AcrR family n=1 Tax=Rhodococcus tukisamuensis TaxID=168276 RepID=A0A1G7EIH6_9NOCA|nr:TetR family transcriptional regulator [Rhodococcus tukisamuensis]SDE63481.1 DNA-binding transcriptional regulator, AcrR family [Rhodococcus tukisamuensis]
MSKPVDLQEKPSLHHTLGLRERKKARTRATIAAHAFRLFQEQGYDATTVQQIIDEAEVSESTFFRYFPTKADVVLSDDFDPLIVEAFLAQPPELNSIQALRVSFRTAFARLSEPEVFAMRERMHLVFSVPDLRAAMLDQFADAMHRLTEAIAARTGHDPGDLAVRTLAGAVVGAMMAAAFALTDDPSADLLALVDTSLAHLEAGFDL